MVVKSLHVALLLFLSGFTSSSDQQEWSPNDEHLPSRNFSSQSEAESKVVLGCSSVQFYLATRLDPNGTAKACLNEKSSIFNGRLNITKPTKILVHGWMNSRETSFTQDTTKAYLLAEDVNVIQVDWSKDARVDYFTSAFRVPQVGYTVAKFILELVRKLDVNVNSVHLIGFSLGAHVAGIAGYYTTPKVAQVIGIDPAGPLFESKGPTGKLTTESGRFVATIHSCKFRLGTIQDLGHLNFNANSGMSQPGCWDTPDHDILGFCSHERASYLFVASLVYPDGFPSIRCSNYWELELGMCNNNPRTYFNGNLDTTLKGIYYFQTASEYPYTTHNATSTKHIPLVRMAHKAVESNDRQTVSRPKTQQQRKKAFSALRNKRLGNSSRLASEEKPEKLKPAARRAGRPSIEVLDRMTEITRVLDQMLGFVKHVDANKELLKGHELPKAVGIPV